MKTILIQTNSARGNKTRISTNSNNMELEIFFKGENKDVRREILILKRTDAGSLRVENPNGLLWQSEGDEAEKLPIK